MDNICFGKELDSLFSNLFRGRLLNTSALIMRDELTGLASAWGVVTLETQQLPQPSLCPVLLAWPLQPPREPGMSGRATQSRRIVGLTSFPSPGDTMGKCGRGALSTFWVWSRELLEAAEITDSPGTWPSLALAFALSHKVGLSRLCCLCWEQFPPATCLLCSFSRDRASASCLKEMGDC